MANTTIIIKNLRKTLGDFDVQGAINASDNEAKTRNYLIEPIFKMLGFQTGFNNGELIPEYDADFASLKGRKVDYAINFRNKPEIIIEAKKASQKLTTRNLRQLNEYFINTSDSKIGVLTNGVDYEFYCRNNEGGVGLHPTPFFSFSLEEVSSISFDQLAKFHVKLIDVKNLVEEAQELFYVDAFEDALFKEFAKPSEHFLKAIDERMGSGVLTAKDKAKLKELINSVSIKSALDRLIVEEASNANSGVITTEEELKVFHVIKTILAQNKKIETSSVGYRDVKSKFSILMDDNQKKKICDLKISPKGKTIIIDNETFEIPDIDSIVKLKKKLTDRALSYVD